MIQINTTKEWEQIKENSGQVPAVLYIHSLSCPVSTAIIHRLSNSPLNETAYIIPVQTSREVSSAIERDTKIKHESPQIIIISRGQPVYNADHWNIDDQKILKKLKELD